MSEAVDPSHLVSLHAGALWYPRKAAFREAWPPRAVVAGGLVLAGAGQSETSAPTGRPCAWPEALVEAWHHSYKAPVVAKARLLMVSWLLEVIGRAASALYLQGSGSLPPQVC